MPVICELREGCELILGMYSVPCMTHEGGDHSLISLPTLTPKSLSVKPQGDFLFASPTLKLFEALSDG